MNVRSRLNRLRQVLGGLPPPGQFELVVVPVRCGMADDLPPGVHFNADGGWPRLRTTAKGRTQRSWTHSMPGLRRTDSLFCRTTDSRCKHDGVRVGRAVRLTRLTSTRRPVLDGIPSFAPSQPL